VIGWKGWGRNTAVGYFVHIHSADCFGDIYRVFGSQSTLICFRDGGI